MISLVISRDQTSNGASLIFWYTFDYQEWWKALKEYLVLKQVLQETCYEIWEIRIKKKVA